MTFFNIVFPGQDVKSYQNVVRFDNRKVFFVHQVVGQIFQYVLSAFFILSFNKYNNIRLVYLI